MSDALLAAIRSNDAQAVAHVLEARPELAATLNGPIEGGSFGQTALMAAVRLANRDTVDVLLRAGADINQKSHWWAGPFHVLDGAATVPWLPSFLIGRGAVMEIHHAVQFSMLEEVRRMVAENPSAVHARGGDGQTPLHFAQTIPMADYLVSRGADIDARDVDHESSPAQYMVRDRQPVARYLLRRGAQADILLASALGDLPRIQQILEGDPGAIRTRVSSEWFPMQDARAGGTIYIWTLGAEPIDADDYVWLVAAASRNRTQSALLMLDAGWPAAADGQPVTALHWAAYHGNVELVRALLARGAPRETRDREHQGTPRNWAHYASEHAGHADAAGHRAVLDLLES